MDVERAKTIERVIKKLRIAWYLPPNKSFAQLFNELVPDTRIGDPLTETRIDIHLLNKGVD